MTHDEMIEAVEAAIRQALSDHAPWRAEPTDFIEEAQVSARAAVRVIAPAVWQPVETAPEDGDMFVTDGTRVEVAFRDSGMSSYRFFSPTTHSDLHFQPTHWMPVPALPSAP